jgi:branched-subunit amino acid aminotransferase/4-amino-4-deoxychorismate lyase
MPSDYIAIEVNGHAADEAAVSLMEHEGWGHFTAMQVRRGRTRGLDLHLSRLEAAHREVYGRALEGEKVRAGRCARRSAACQQTTGWRTAPRPASPRAASCARTRSAPRPPRRQHRPG